MLKRSVLLSVFFIFVFCVTVHAESPFAAFGKIKKGLDNAKSMEKNYILLKEIPGLEKYEDSDFDPTKGDKTQLKYMWVSMKEEKWSEAGKKAAMLKLSLDFSSRVSESAAAKPEDIATAIKTIAMVETDAKKFLDEHKVSAGSVALSVLKIKKMDEDDALQISNTMVSDVTLVSGNAIKVKAVLEKRCAEVKCNAAPGESSTPPAAPPPPDAEKK